jgi:hypothetical protein
MKRKTLKALVWLGLHWGTVVSLIVSSFVCWKVYSWFGEVSGSGETLPVWARAILGIFLGCAVFFLMKMGGSFSHPDSD